MTARLALLYALLLACGRVSATAQNNDLGRVLPGAGLLLETVQDQARNKVEFVGQKSFTEEELRTPLAEEIRERSPGTRILLTSGFTEHMEI